jgi:glycerol uptake facilitator-like aquaporin
MRSTQATTKTMLRGTAREAAAEFLGTFVLIVFGVGGVAQVVLSGGKNGQYLSINLGWAFGVILGVYVAGGVSDAHLNPAVTLTLAVLRGFPWRKVVPYCLAQFAGAFAASALVYLTYFDALNNFDGGVRQVLGLQGTGGIWATYPQSFFVAAARRSDRPNRRRRSINVVHLCAVGRAEPRAVAQRCAGAGRYGSADDWHDFRLQLRLRH